MKGMQKLMKLNDLINLIGDMEVYIEGIKYITSKIPSKLLDRKVDRVYSCSGTMADYKSHFLDIRLS